MSVLAAGGKPALDQLVDKADQRVDQSTERSRQRQRLRHPVGGTDLGRAASTEAKRLAAAILEVLAGVRTTSDAALAVGLSLTRYYQVESRALAGLVQACEPRSKGAQPNPERQVTALRRDNERLQREVSRQQALVRLSQRSVGLAAPAPPPKIPASGKKPRRRRPVARALHVANRLQPTTPTVPDAERSLQQGTE
jgi:hypothetical protein